MESLQRTDTEAAPPSIPEEAPLVGKTLGKYELREVLGQGAMGRVYLGRHAQLGREMAIKVLRREHGSNPELVARFFQEARAVNQINHDHIVQIFDFVQDPPEGDHPGRVYCVMERLSGQSLTAKLASGPMLIDDVVQMGRQVCSALEAAHRLGVIHRDIKPDNVFLTRRGEATFTKVLDFGVAKLSRSLDQVPLVSTTQQGAIIGTPAYMSPEQAASLDVDHRTDIYSLGVVLFEALAGAPPYTSASFGKLLVEIITQKVPNLPRQTPAGEAIPPALAALVRRCMAKQPEGRPQTMAELAQGLALVDPVRSPAPGRSSRAGWAVAALGVIGLALGAGLWPRAAVPSVPPVGAAPTTLPRAPAAEALAPTTVSAPAPTVNVTVNSTPLGASVVRLDTGARLGATPFTGTLPREARDVELRLELSGYLPEVSRVRLNQDVVWTATLQGAPSAPVAPSVPGKAKKKAVSRDADIDPFAP